jgi:PKD repeat protein
MFKKLFLLALFLVLTTSTLALSLDFNESKIGRERSLRDNILLPPGSYNQDSNIKISLSSDTDQKTIHQLLNCTSNCQQSSSGFYTYTGATDPAPVASNFLTGLRVREGSTVSIDAKFNISNEDTSYPDGPKIDVGNDGTIEWEFPGKAPTTIDWNVNPYSGPLIHISDAAELNLDATGTCQQLFLNKSDTFKINATLKKSITNPPSLGAYIQGFQTTTSACDPLTTSFSPIECTLSLDSPIESGNYKVCLTALSSGIVLAANNTAEKSQGYRCSSSSCTKTIGPQTDYAIHAKSSNFETALKESLEYLESNTKSGDFLKDAIASYIQTCNHQDNHCIIPINISTKNNANVKIHDLSYTETLSDGQTYNRNKFLLGVQSQGVQNIYETTVQNQISLNDFDILTPDTLGNYTLTVEHGSEILTANIQVVPAPKANFNASSILEPILKPITFDGSLSKGDSNLTYAWDFGDNRTSIGKLTTHSYLTSGNFKVTLTVTDENGIEDEVSLNIEAFSETASQDLVQNTVSNLEALRQTYTNSIPDIKETYISLGLETKIQDSIDFFQTAPALTESKVNEILNEIPSNINVINTVKISPYLSITQVNELYGFESESYKSTLQELNSRFQRTVTARQVSLTFPTSTETFILVTKRITSPEPISDVTLVEVIPNSLAPDLTSLEFVDSLPQTTRLENYQSARYTIPQLQDEFTLNYKLKGNNLNAIKDTILVIIPRDLSPSLIPFNCGDKICNPAEDILSCPEDCTEQPTEGDFPWFYYILTVVLILGTGFTIWKLELYKKIKLEELTSLFNSQKSPFKSGVEMSKVRSYIKSALDRGYDKEKISSTLLDQGWSKTQVEHAFKKLKKK